MTFREYRRDLEFFADILDRMPSSRLKGDLSRCFTSFSCCYNDLFLYRYIFNSKSDSEVKNG